MSLGRLQHRLVALTAATAFAAILSTPGEAEAGGPVQTWGKGTAGGALLGAEVVVIPMGAAGLNKGWPYFVFGGLGMVGGAIGGYFLDKQFAVQTDANGNVTGGGPAEPSLYMLAGGMALIIPAVIVSLNATAYRPPESDRSEPANNEPSKEPVKSPGATPGAPPAVPGEGPPPGSTSLNPEDSRERAPTYHYRSYRGRIAAMPHIPTSLLDMYRGQVGFGLPAVQVRPLYTQAEVYKYGVAQGTEVQLPVFKAMF